MTALYAATFDRFPFVTYDPKPLENWDPKVEIVQRPDIEHVKALLKFTKRLGSLGHPQLQCELLDIIMDYLEAPKKEEEGEEENG